MKRILLLVALSAFLAVPGLAEDCVEVDLEVAPELWPGEIYYFYAELTNCGDEAAVVYLDVSINYILGSIEVTDIPIFMGAGETFSRSVPFMLPDCAPSGEGGLCVTAASGGAEATDCVEFTIFNPGWGLSDKASDKQDKDTQSTGAIR
jgi:hypothetical protein